MSDAVIESSGNGTWSADSKKDPRFNGSGRAYGMFDANAKIDEHVLGKEKALGVTAPDDIEISFWKD